MSRLLSLSLILIITTAFVCADKGESGEKTVHQKIPDTITSWVLTAGFSLSPDVGLGITTQPRKIEVFQPFFVSTSVSYSIKRGEVIAIPAIVFNYQDTDAEVTITFDNSEKEFEFVHPSTEIGADDAVRTIRARVKQNSGVTKSFLVRPKKVGHLSLNLKAVIATAGDAIKQVLLCEPEGITQYFNKEYLINLKDRKLHPSPSSVRISAKGTGSALVQVSYRYNVVKEDESPKFTLKRARKESVSPELLILSVCTSFNGDGEQKTSNMALMEVSLPSGYIVDPDNLAELEKIDRVQRVETKNGDTVVILYFDYLDSTEICPEIKGLRAHHVTKQKPAPIEVYDYYKPSRRATEFYQIQ